MTYTPEIPASNDEKIRAHIRSEFDKIATEFKNPNPNIITLEKLYVIPAKPRNGMFGYFDAVVHGAEGFYGYYGGVWVSL